MSTPDQPLTRKQLREIQRTGATPVIDPDAAALVQGEPAVDASAPAHPPVSAFEPSIWAPEVASVDAPGALGDTAGDDDDDDDEASTPVAAQPSPVPGLIVSTPLGSTSNADEPIAAHAVVSNEDVDLDATPLTRREAREQERIRTSSVPVISTEMNVEKLADADAVADVRADIGAGADADLVATETETAEGESGAAELVDAGSPELVDDAEGEEVGGTVADVDGDEPSASDVPEVVADVEPATNPEAAITPEPAPVLYAGFGGNLLIEDPQFATPAPASFDQLIARGGSTTGSATATNALILSQTPSSAPLAGAVTATGEILVTGTLSLPEGLGSTGHDPRLSDGKEIDALLVDGGELPAASSPTPIAASAAISTIKGSGDIIKPPAPEKGSRLMFTLAITAGVLALALVGVLILGFISGALR